MRTHNDLDRLSGAAPALLARTELVIDTDEEDRILARIVDSPRRSVRRERTPRLRTAVVLVGAALALAVIGAAGSGVFTSSHPQIALSGAEIKLAGYHFRTPAGFRANASCADSPGTWLKGAGAAASADGGCIEGVVMVSTSGSAVPAGANRVDVGAYQGYLVPPDSSQKTTLYVVLPHLGTAWQALVLYSTGLTTEQLVAVAESGLPQNPDEARTIGPT
jgi:hypothetical protein